MCRRRTEIKFAAVIVSVRDRQSVSLINMYLATCNLTIRPVASGRLATSTGAEGELCVQVQFIADLPQL